MCLKLVKDKKEKKVATENIVCYKFLKYSNYTHKWMSPWYGDINWTIGKKFSASNWYKDYPDENYINGGYFHTYDNEQSAILEAQAWDLTQNWCNDYTVAVFKCIIPKGSIYYDGFHNGEVIQSGYASKKLELIDKIKVIQNIICV